MSQPLEFLVKSANQLLGPFSKEELIRELRSKHISLIDEVKTAGSRWRFIREHQEFLDVVRAVRSELEQVVEDTGTLTQTVATATITLTDSVDRVPSNIKSSPLEDFKSYSPPNLKSTGDNRFLILAAIIVMIVLTSSFFIIKSKRQIKSAMQGPSVKNQVMLLSQTGLYKEAFDLLQKIPNANSSADEQQIQLAPLTIAFSNQSYEAREALEKITLSANLKPPQQAEIYNYIALSYIKDQDYVNARTYLEKSLSYNTNYFPAKYNLAVIEYLQKNFLKASAMFDELYKQSHNAVAALSMLFSTIQKEKKENSMTQIDANTLLSEIDDYNWQVEKSVLDFYVRVRKSNGSEAEIKLKEIMKNNLEFSMNKSANIRLSDEVIGWKNFMDLCAEIYDQNSIQFENMLLYSICLLQNERYTEANQIIGSALKKQPNHPYVLFLQSLLLKKMGQTEQAMSIIKVLAESQNNENISHLLASVCFEKNDMACAEKNWNQVIIRNPRSLEALTGLGWVTLKRGDRSASLNYLKRGMSISEVYIPLLKLKYELEK